MTMAVMDSELKSKGYDSILARYFSEDRLEELSRKGEEAIRIIQPLFEAVTEDHLELLLPTISPELGDFYESFLPKVEAELIQQTQDVDNTLTEITDAIYEIIWEHVHNLENIVDGGTYHRLVIAVEDMRSMDEWALDRYLSGAPLGSLEDDRVTLLQNNAITSASILLSLFWLLLNNPGSSSIPVLIDKLYKYVTHMNFVLDDQGSGSFPTKSNYINLGEWKKQSPQNLEKLGYGVGRWDDDTDDLDDFLEEIHQMRHQE